MSRTFKPALNGDDSYISRARKPDTNCLTPQHLLRLQWACVSEARATRGPFQLDVRGTSFIDSLTHEINGASEQRVKTADCHLS